MSTSRRLHPDEPPLDRDGDLELTDELEQVADRLRREADGLARHARPHLAWQSLFQQLPESRRRHGGRRMGLAVLLTAVCLGFVWAGTAWQARYQRRNVAGERAEFDPRAPHPLPAEIGGAADTRKAGTPLPIRSSDFDSYLDVGAEPVSLGPVSDAERIEMLEAALDSYRAAILAQQDRIRQTELKLQQAEQEIARWKQDASGTNRASQGAEAAKP